MSVKAPRFNGLQPRSAQTSRAASGASRKRDTSSELILRRALWHLGLRYRVDVKDLPGRPDVVFAGARVAVFCDGDFWHGRNLAERVRRLRAGHNAPYWIAKIRANVARDRRHDTELRAADWIVLRYWETDILRDVAPIADEIAKVVRARRSH
jgi:DNA mismatch endonuclease (patch repair protein)